MVKKFYVSKTVIFFALALIVAVANLFGFAGFELSVEQQEIISVVVAIVGIILRFVTKEPIKL